MKDLPTEPGDETRAADDPLPADMSTIYAPSDSDPDPDFSAGVDAIDAVGAQGPPRVGQVYFGRYLVERQIGEGGMGTVWLVRHVELDSLRALKLIVSGIAFDPQIRARFRREARAMARLSHPNAITVHDVRIGRDSAFIEMEFIRGKSLNNLMKPGVPMPLDWIARIVEQLCDVLQEAHDSKIVHRDLKPSNLMLVADRPPGKEMLKVLDFGIAKILESESNAEGGEVRTGTGHFLGSAPWSSPEQAAGEDVDARSDLYSVGVILYELLTGYRPFNGPLVRQLYDHLHTPPPPFAKVNPKVELPSAVEQVVRRCLAKKPEDRPQTARDLAAEFLWAVADENGTPSVARPSPRGPAAEPGRTEAALSNSLPDAPVDVLLAALAQTELPAELAVTQANTLHDEEILRHDTLVATEAVPRIPKADATKSHDFESATSDTKTKVKARSGMPMLGVVLTLLTVFGWKVWSSRPVHKVVATKTGLPEGYMAEGKTADDSSPPVLVRIEDKAQLIRIAGGTFMMGTGLDKPRPESGKTEPADAAKLEDQPAHPVTLSDYYLQETEVTNGQMDAYFRACKIDRSARPRRFQQAWDIIAGKEMRSAENYPAVGIDRALAEKYARWVRGKLPTEAQWEFAARSRGKEIRYVPEWEGTQLENQRFANVNTLGDHSYLTTSEVRAYRRDRTEQSIYDLTGNVREWCRDRWARYEPASKSPALDPQGPDSPDAGPLDFVIRGGSFATWPDYNRTTWPRRAYPDDNTAKQLLEDGTADDLGFRVVIEWPRTGVATTPDKINP